MKKFQYFWIFSDNDNGYVFKPRNDCVELKEHWGTRFLDYHSGFVSRKLKNLIESLDVNHLIEFRRIIFEDENYSDKEYYVMHKVPVFNCLNIDKCIDVEFGKRDVTLKLQKMDTLERKSELIQFLSAISEKGVALTNAEYKATFDNSLYISIDRQYFNSDLLKKYGSPIFYVAGRPSSLYCNSAFVKACRKQGISGMWWTGIPSDLSGGEPDGFLSVNSPTIKKQSVEYEEVKAFISDFTKWLAEIAQTEAFQKYKSILFGLYNSDEGTKIYTAGASHKRFGWEEDCDEPLSYLQQTLNKTATEALFFVNEAIVENEALLKGKKVLFGFDDGDVYKPKKFKK